MLLGFPAEAVKDGATVELAADDAREVEAVTLLPDEIVTDEEAGSEEDVGETEFPTDDASVTVLEADTEAVDEAIDSVEEDSAADDEVGDVEDEMDADSDDAGADGTWESDAETAVDDTDGEDWEDTVLDTADVSDAVDDTNGAPVLVAEAVDEDESEEAGGSVDEAGETELVVCDDAPDGTAADVDGTNEVAVPDEFDGLAEFDDVALGPVDRLVVTEAEDPTALLPDEEEADVTGGARVEDVTDDGGTVVVE